MKEITIEDIHGSIKYMEMYGKEYDKFSYELASEEGVLSRDNSEKAKNLAYKAVIEKLNAERAQESEMGL
jgi:hypothetical protein